MARPAVAAPAAPPARTLRREAVMERAPVAGDGWELGVKPGRATPEPPPTRPSGDDRVNTETAGATTSSTETSVRGRRRPGSCSPHALQCQLRPELEELSPAVGMMASVMRCDLRLVPRRARREAAPRRWT